MLEDNKYRNFHKTENSIKKALIKLYRQKGSINRISVKELCETANISRSTFYLHYNDLMSIFESVGDKFIDSLKDMIMELINMEIFEFKSFLHAIFTSINESNELIKIGLSSEYPLYYIENVKDKLESLIMNSPILSDTKYGKTQTMVEIRIVVSGMIDYIINIIRRNDKIDVDLYTEIFNNFLTRWTDSLM